ncbi:MULTISPECIES: TetR/AcrR family transcriptional regulator [Roseobacteraceae]|jgi:AcrR family transcriptional regulator|uniref:TetR family transcriptional regulator n=1 Tax=Pseudosulfitobacter pseudonitzschiae TaxID=1402135 RepID=A0A221K5H3_9RHOB|nr:MULTISPECIES: TetR/AcrR family transcriptional regulator [Roseobacteraceae]ASM74113.1 TetR family transcriptional regulator [Pseudosulfitobacter pseudonitzschiae]
MNTQRPTIRKGRKFDQVLEGARSVFLVDGFEGASVDQIAKVAGVSKATLYSYFPDKRLLFMEVAASECCRQSRAAVDMINGCGHPREVLEQAARHLLGFLTSTFGLQMFRICVAESERFPDLGRQFYASGPMVMKGELIHYFEGAVARGELAIDDMHLAADQFGELCKADLWPRLVFGVTDSVSQAEINRVVHGAVDVFMARYGA